MNNNDDPDTSMYPELLANSDKLVDERDRTYFQKSSPTKDKIVTNLTANQLCESLDTYIIPQNHTIQILKDDINDDILPPPPIHTPPPPSHTPLQDTKKEMTEIDELRRKNYLLKELEKLRTSGVKLSQNFDMNSRLDDLEKEYSFHKDERSKQNSVKLMGSVLLIVINLLQMTNDHYNPFDFKLEGWQDCVISDMDNYYDVLGEIYEKYYKPGTKSPPEIKLLMLLIGSIMSLQVKKYMSQLINPQKTPEKQQDKQQDKQPDKQQENILDKKFKQYTTKSTNDKIQDIITKNEDIAVINKNKTEYEKLQSNVDALKDKLVMSTSRNEQSFAESIKSESISRKSVISINPDIDKLLESESNNIRYDEISLGKNLNKSRKSEKSNKSNKSR